METIKIKPQTVILFVGPKQCGKTHFAQNVLIPFFEEQRDQINKNLNIQYLSSEYMRHSMMGHLYEPYPEDPVLDYVSEQAFLMLKTQLTAVLSYPVNADFVIVDTTGMSESFRQEIKQITFAANYNLHLFVFDYKDRDEYFEFIPTSDQSLRKKVADSIKRFRDRMGELNKKEYPLQSRIKSKYTKKSNIEIDKFDEYKKYFLDQSMEYSIIGDVHGCFDELIALLREIGYVFNDDFTVQTAPPNRKLIFIGDLIDKGQQIELVVRFVDRLINDGHAFLVRGNHENFVYNYMKGVKAYTDLGTEFIQSFIQSVEVFEQQNETGLKEIFFKMFEDATDFLSTERFIVTHAPCKTQYLGKVRREALKMQRNFRFARRRDFATEEEFVANAEKEMSFMREESRYNHPYHIVGHVMLPNVVSFNNKYMIDTGCVAGGRLTALTIGPDGPPRAKSVQSNRESTGEIFPLFTGPKKFEIDELDPKEQTRIKFLCLEKVNFISGTMAPADKDIQNNVLESMQQGIKYYKDAGVKRLILEPKYMGSRGNVYLFKDVEKSYVVTRNGYLVKPQVHEALKPALTALRDRIFSKVFVNKDVKMILLDAEILPWSLIGGGLINQHFKPVSIAVESESQQLVEHGFEAVLQDIEKSDDYANYKHDRREGKKDELTEKYGHTKERTFRNLHDYKHMSLQEEIGYSNAFKAQLAIHGSEDDPQIEPFAILKVVFEDDTEFLFEKESNIQMYSLISQRPYAVLDFEVDAKERARHPELYEFTKDEFFVDVIVPVENGPDKIARSTVSNYFDLLTKTHNMEGVVIKPETVFTPGIAPYIKVRNEDYLMIVYGHNYKFENKFNKLIKKKGVKKKLQTSIKEFELGMKMLRTPYKDINPENNQYKQLLAQMIIEVEKEKQLDPRL